MRRLQQLTLGLSDVAALATAAMILITIADILMKNIFNRPIHGTFELVEFLLVCIVFFGIAEVFRSSSNICVDIVDQLLSAGTVTACKVFSALSCVFFLVLIGWAMIGPAWDTVTYPQWTQELGIPLYAYWIPILAGTGLAIIAAAAASWLSRRPM